MKKVFIDSNVFLRLFIVDDEAQLKAAKHLIEEAAKGRLRLVIGPPVLFEVAWTLRSAKLPRPQILQALRSIVTIPGVALIDADVVAAALELADTSGQEFSDAYIVASSRKAGAGAVATFNRKHFEKLGASLHEF